MRKVFGVLVISGMLAIASVLLIGFDALTNAAVNAPHLTTTASPSPTPNRAYMPAVAVPELPVTNTVTGTVVINGGACCAGGNVGDSITLSVQFAATSAAGPVTRMRTGPRSALSQTSWKAFAPVLFYALKINAINWTGLEICAQFRDAQDQVSMPVCDDISIEGMPASPSPETATATSTPTSTPTVTPTTQTITGSVKIFGSPCCAGGIVGTYITLSVNFTGTSSAGSVTHMRTNALGPIDQAPWEALTATRTYSTYIYISNWFGWGICAQFKDTQGNLTPSLCDYISLEGMPDWNDMTVVPYLTETATQTPTPTSTSDGSPTMTATPTLTPSPTFALSGT